VVDRRAVAPARDKQACVESELARQLLQHCGMSSRRQAGVGDACHVIEHHAAGALEESLAELVMREIEQTRDRVWAAHHEVLQQLRPPLAAPRRCKHGIQHDRAVVVKAHPVVREHRVGAARLRSIFNHVDRDSRAAQRRDQTIELRQRCRREPRIVGRASRLEAIAVVGFRVPAEGRRPDHEGGPGGLSASGTGVERSSPGPTHVICHVRSLAGAPACAADVGH